MNVLRKYKFGSRLYGTYTETSDYDYVLILTDDSTKNLLNNYTNPATTDKILFTFMETNQTELFEYHVKIYDLRHFTIMFENTDTNITYICLIENHYIDMIHANLIWVAELVYQGDNITDKYLKFFRDSYEVNRLIASTKYETNYAFTKAKCLFRTDSYRGQKNIFHAFRFHIYALQIIRTGKLTDFDAANIYLDRTMIEFNNHFEYNDGSLSDLRQQLDTYKQDPYKIYPTRIIPKYLKQNEQIYFYNLREYKDNHVVVKVHKIKYMDGRDIIGTGPNGFITKHDILSTTNINHIYMDVVMLPHLPVPIARFNTCRSYYWLN